MGAAAGIVWFDVVHAQDLVVPVIRLTRLDRTILAQDKSIVSTQKDT